MSSSPHRWLRERRPLCDFGRPAVPIFVSLTWTRRSQLQEVTGQDAQLTILGTEAGFFEKRMTVLMPALAWLPQAGAAVSLDDPRRHPADFFQLDLEVSGPRGWFVAGPGRSESLVVEGALDRSRVRLRPASPFPEVALIAGRFERRTKQIEGVEIELLFDRAHQRNLSFFADALPEIERRVAEILSGARELGLAYPYEALTLVEVPWTLRSFGGGWRMDTVQAPPGMLLLSEGAFPTARFEFRFRNPDRFEEQEGGIARAKLEAVESFFENDFSGGNILHGAARNFFLHQTAGHGPEALALDVLCHDLANRLITGREGYFSAHLFDTGMGWVGMGVVLAERLPRTLAGQGAGETLARTLIRGLTDRPEVWDAALGSSLTEMEPWEDPRRAVNVLALKGTALADSILDSAGRSKAGAMLAALVREHRGSTFGADDLMAAAHEAEIDLEAMLGDFLHQTELPGFTVSEVDLDRLRDDDHGLPQYQTRLFVYNGEPVPGLLRLRYITGEDDQRSTWESGDPVRIGGRSSIELGLVTSRPPRRLLVAPYLSLNRREFALALPEIDEEKTLQAEPLRGARPADWRPGFTEHIVVDDLDEGFAVTEQERQGGLRLGGGLRDTFSLPTVEDQGLPAHEFGPPPDSWSRLELDSTWGRYRRTVVLVAAGEGTRIATFGAEIPDPGRWRIEIHIPASPSGRLARFLEGWNVGSYDLSLRAGSSEQPIEFDAAAAEAGWSALGDFDLEAGRVEVALSDKTSGSLVLADALRFLPLDGAGGGGRP